MLASLKTDSFVLSTLVRLHPKPLPAGGFTRKQDERQTSCCQLKRVSVPSTSGPCSLNRASLGGFYSAQLHHVYDTEPENRRLQGQSGHLQSGMNTLYTSENLDSTHCPVIFILLLDPYLFFLLLNSSFQSCL